MPRIVGALPAQLPEGTFTRVIAALRGTGDKWDGVEAAYDLLGYGLSVARSSSSTLPARSAAAGVPDNLTAADELEKFVQAAQKQPMPEAKASDKGEEEQGGSRVVTSMNLPPYLIALLLRFLTQNATT
jgi:hypothetical protein